MEELFMITGVVYFVCGTIYFMWMPYIIYTRSNGGGEWLAQTKVEQC